MARRVLRERSSSADLNVIRWRFRRKLRECTLRHNYLLQHYHAATSASRTNTIPQKHFGLAAEFT